MELEEAIKMVEYIKNETKMACEFPKATERDKSRWGKEVQALEKILKYIKEESISRAVVEEAKAYIEYYAMNNFALTDFDLREKAFRHILELLNKGE